MRAGIAWVFIAVILAATLAWGWSVGGETVPLRPVDQTAIVDADWYAVLPLDPTLAVGAYLARIPADMRVRGEGYSDTRVTAFGLRLLTLVLATAGFCFSGFAARSRDAATRVLPRSTLVDAAVAVQYFGAMWALSLPAEIYAGFVRPHRIGFSDQSFISWVGDQLVNWGVFTVFYVVGVLIIYRCIRRQPTQWVAWAIGIYFVLRLLYAVLSPGIIEPLTNDFRPMPEGPKKQIIQALARANGVDDAVIVVGDASRQSRLMNAHVSGFGGTARISVDDTTLQRTNVQMIRFVIAHEIGHFVLDHDIAFVISDTLLASLGFMFIATSMRALLRRFGARLRISHMGDIATLPLFWGLFLFWGFLSLPANNAISRVFERQADLFGLNASRAPNGMAEFMIHDADIARLRPTTIEYALFYTHPSDAERVATAMQWRAANQPTSP